MCIKVGHPYSILTTKPKNGSIVVDILKNFQVFIKISFSFITK